MGRTVRYGPFEKYVEVPHELAVTGVSVGQVLLVDVQAGKYWLEDADKPEVEEAMSNTDFPRHTSGGWYELSDGQRIKGKAKAHELEEALSGSQ